MRRGHQTRAARAASIVVLALTVASCGGDSGEAEVRGTPTSVSPTPSPSPSNTGVTQEPKTPKPEGTTITTAPSAFGQILWGPERQVVYIWESEPSSKAECYGDCAVAWPPVLTTGEPVAAGQVKAKLLGTTTRRDGSTQVTYNGHPLYYYAHEGPGEVECHNVATHGGLWWVITPAGDRAA